MSRRSRLVRLPGARTRGRLLVVAKVLISVAAVITLVAVNMLTAMTLSVFLIVGQAFIVIGALLALFVTATDFLRSRGTSQVHFEPGEIIFREGDDGDLVYVIMEGQVQAIHQQPGGEEQILNTMGPGEYFGEMALISDAPRTATTRALTAVDAVAMARTDFTTLYAYLPNLRVNVEKVMKERQAHSARLEASSSRAAHLFLLAALGALVASLAPSRALAADPTAGAKLYEQEGCAQCHGFKGKGDGYLLGMLKEKPTMRDWTDPKAMDGLTDEYMIEITEKGGEAIGKSKVMLKYSHKLNREQITDIVAWIRTLK